MHIMYVSMVYRCVLVLMPGYVSSNDSVLEIGRTQNLDQIPISGAVELKQKKLEKCLDLRKGCKNHSQI